MHKEVKPAPGVTAYFLFALLRKTKSILNLGDFRNWKFCSTIVQIFLFFTRWLAHKERKGGGRASLPILLFAIQQTQKRRERLFPVSCFCALRVRGLRVDRRPKEKTGQAVDRCLTQLPFVHTKLNFCRRKCHRNEVLCARILRPL